MCFPICVTQFYVAIVLTSPQVPPAESEQGADVISWICHRCKGKRFVKVTAPLKPI